MKLSSEKLSACVPYEDEHGKFLQLPDVSCFNFTIQNTTGAYFSVAGLEQGFPAGYDFLVYGIGSIVSLPYTYGRIQWPNGHYLSQVPVDLWNFGGIGRNGRLLTRRVFIPKKEVVRLEIGTQQALSTVQLFFEGCILIPV